MLDTLSGLANRFTARMRRLLTNVSYRRVLYMNTSKANATALTVMMACVVTSLILLAPRVSVADSFTELRVPLEENRYYDPAAVLAALHPERPPAKVPQKREELTPLMKAGLLAIAAGFPEAMQVRFEPDLMILKIADSKDPVVRQKIRKRIAKVFRIPPRPADSWGLERPDKVDATKRSVLLIHGLESSKVELELMRRAFHAWGVQTFTFVYPNDDSLVVAGLRLREQLIELKRECPELRLVIVAHSAGGLVSRYAIESKAPPPTCVTDLFTLGTPHQGSSLAIGQPWVELLDASWKDKLNPLSGMDDGVGQAVDQLLPASDFLKKLNARPRPAGIRYHTAAGRKGFISANSRDKLLAAMKDYRADGDRRRASILDALMGPELQTGKGDGAVTLDSALLKDANTTRVFDLNHSELIRQKDVAPTEGKVFRWIVDTLSWRQAADHGKAKN